VTITEQARDTALARDVARTALWIAGTVAAIRLVSLVFGGLGWLFIAARGPMVTGSGPAGDIYSGISASASTAVAGTFIDFAQAVVFTIVPFAVGVFLVLWLLLPVRSGTSFVQLAMRGLVASFAGALLATIGQVVVSGITGGTTLVPTLLGMIPLAVVQAPVVVLVLVVRHLVPRRAEA
jgi:hypothetical protein